MATITKRGDSFLIMVSMGYAENGRQIRKTTTYKPPKGTSPGKAAKLADAAAHEFESRVKGLPTIDENQTLGALCDWFFLVIAPNKIRERTIANYKNVLNLHVLPTLGNIKLKDLTAARFDTLFSGLSKGGSVMESVKLHEGSPLPEWVKRKLVKTAKEMGISDPSLKKAVDGESIKVSIAAKIAAYYKKTVAELFEPIPGSKALSGTTVHSVYTALSSIFQSAYKAGIIKENTLRRTTPPPTKSKAIEGVFLDEEQAQEFLALLDEQPQSTYRAAFITLLYMGLRSGELRALHWEDIDLNRGLLYIRHGLYYKDGAFMLTPPKTASSVRVLKMPQDVLDILVEYKGWQDKQIANLKPVWNDDGIVFPNTTGGYLDAQSFNKKLKKLIADSGLPNIHVHSLRHTCASLLINNHTTAATVAAHLGHSSVDTTNRVYIHSFQSAQAAAAEGLQTILRKTAAGK
ncbi:MAG: site-specific integrase [Clostridiales bacterium]|nr:site-specific integrase [Clostridiales bacterium]